jgi:deazaflavin-dependent oxidoreductase (nitroreductase family)
MAWKHYDARVVPEGGTWRQAGMSEATSTSPTRRDGDSRLAAVREAAAEHASKHRRLIRSARDGRLLSALMLPWVLAWPGSGYGVITTTGRKTGKVRRKCIRVIRRGNKAYIVSLRPPELAMVRPSAVAAWVWNIRSNPSVRLRIRGGTFAGLARELTDQVELAEARAAFCEKVSLMDYGEGALHLRGLPSRAKIEELHRYWFDTGTPLVVELVD